MQTSFEKMSVLGNFYVHNIFERNFHYKLNDAIYEFFIIFYGKKCLGSFKLFSGKFEILI